MIRNWIYYVAHSRVRDPVVNSEDQVEQTDRLTTLKCGGGAAWGRGRRSATEQRESRGWESAQRQYNFTLHSAWYVASHFICCLFLSYQPSSQTLSQWLLKQKICSLHSYSDLAVRKSLQNSELIGIQGSKIVQKLVQNGWLFRTRLDPWLMIYLHMKFAKTYTWGECRITFFAWGHTFTHYQFFH